MNHYKAIIIGAGPAGLAAGYELTKNGQSALILERENQVGGLCRTINYQGFRFDIGGHRFFTKNKEVLKLWQDMLGNDFLTRPRLSRMYYKKKFFAYPIKPLDVLKKMGPIESLKAFFSFVKGKIKYFPKRKNLIRYRDWVIYNFGEHLFKTFFESYNEKGWGLKAEEMSSEWYQQRVKGISFLSLIKTTLLPFTRKKIRSLINEFNYPRLGPGMMYDKFAEKIIENGGEVNLNSEVVKIKHDGGIVEEVVYRRDGQETIMAAENFISTLPLTHLLNILEPTPPQEVLTSLSQLRYRSFLTVCLIIDKPIIFPDNWIYIHEPSVKVARIQNFKNWSPELVPEKNKTSLGMEFFCWQNDELWNMTDKDLIMLAADELKKIRIGNHFQIVDGLVIRAANSYPIYALDYKQHLDKVINYLFDFKNFFSIGRAGMYRWNNMDHSILTGLYTARNLMGNNLDISAINAHAEYQEEDIDKQ